MTDDIIKFYLTHDEARAFVKKHRRGRQCYVRFGFFGFTQLPDDEGNSRGFDMTGLVPVGAKVALKAIEDTQAYAKRDVKLSVSYSKNCIFIG